VTDSAKKKTPEAILLPEDGGMTAVAFDDLTDDDKSLVLEALIIAGLERTEDLNPKVAKMVGEFVAGAAAEHASKALMGVADERLTQILGQKTWKKMEAELSTFNQLVSDGKVATKVDLSNAVSPEALGAIVREYVLSMKVEDQEEVSALASGLELVILSAMQEETQSVIEQARIAAQEAVADKQATTPWGQVYLDGSRIMGRAPFDPLRSAVEGLAFGFGYKFLASKIGFLPESRAVVVTVGAGLVAVTEGTILFFSRRSKSSPK